MQSPRRIAFIGVFALCLIGCGDGSGSDESPVPAWEPGQPCPEDRVVLKGELDAAPVGVNVEREGYEFNQGADPHTLWVIIQDGKLDMTWTATVAVGQTTSASATLDVPASLPHGGETLCAESAELSPLEHEWNWTLTNLAPCGGGAAIGTLKGCFYTM